MGKVQTMPVQQALGSQIINQQAAGQVAQMRQMILRAKGHLEKLEGENASLQVRVKHLTGVLIGLMQTHECFQHNNCSARVPESALDEIGPDIGIDTDRDDVTKDIVVRIMTAAEHQKRIMGFMDGTQEQLIPKKPPFEFKIDVPPGGKFAFLHSVTYVGGKSDGKQLVYTSNRPKKPRDFTVDDSREGEIWLKFTTDSAGMKIKAVFSFKVNAPEVTKENTSELIFVNAECEAWHKHENDGIVYVGSRCSVCGDSRKVLVEAQAQE